MKRTLETEYYADIDKAVDIIRSGGMVIMTDASDRENEGDLVQAGEHVTKDSINFMASYAKGLICAPMSEEIAEKLSLPLMVKDNTCIHSTAFTVSVDAAEGTTTGISAAERAETILQLTDCTKKGEDFRRPGHIFPLIAHKEGVAARKGHTEGSVDLVTLAGLKPVSAICEIMKDDGEMARGKDLEVFAEKHNLKIITIEDLADYKGKQNGTN